MSRNARKKNDTPEAKVVGSKKSTYHHGDLAQALVAAGRQILLEKGTDGLSLRAVAARVGVSQAAPYSHFTSKKDLLRAISASGFSELAGNMIASAAVGKSPQNTLLNYGVAYIEFAINNPDIYRLMFARIDPNARSDHRNVIFPQADILNKEAARAYRMIFDLYQPQCKDNDQATILSDGAWGLVHGLASLITEGLIKLPKTGRDQYLRELLASQIRIPG
ncbi:MAG: TetR/AcrR family transcriptional regulator [Rhodobacteraceae bacterium]|nr:TetR/AcrR family transcriptional regulator [Paracoccaceae bacterium]